MKKYILFMLLFSCFSAIVYAQNTEVEIGDIFRIGEVDNDNYKHINFPKLNFIVKKGGIPTYNNIKGEKVEITSIKEQKDGSLLATIKLTSRRSFFNSHKYVTVAINEAIENKELLRI